MKKFTNIIKEGVDNTKLIPIRYSVRFKSILLKIFDRGNQIAKELLDRENFNFVVSFIDVTENDTISYITANKAIQIIDKYKIIGRELEAENYCWINNRQEQKINRFIIRLLGDINQKQLEDFTNEYKMELMGDKTFENFNIVDGTDIKKYYSEENYSRDSNGQLQHSCMKYHQCQKFFDLYLSNPDKMKMLILKKPKSDLIYGRANLWYLDSHKDRVFMDRIYTTYDWQIKLFIDYAIKNDFIFKSKQLYGGSVIPLVNRGKKENMVISVNLKKKVYDYYPYVDTMQFYNPSNGNLTSDVEKFHDKEYVTLVMANGRYFLEGNEGFKIDYIGRIVHEAFVYWSVYDNVYIHKNDAVRLGYRDDFVTPEHEFIRLNGNIYLKEDLDYDEEKKTYKLKKNI
jgi:hypothetical protein